MKIPYWAKAKSFLRSKRYRNIGSGAEEVMKPIPAILSAANNIFL